ncbi:hypothetical protein KDA23_07135 [Candidatus Saccharibacteria bacterium]|nr:hypothetical protein [Candidatus Saccharibacteria bacterium]
MESVLKFMLRLCLAGVLTVTLGLFVFGVMRQVVTDQLTNITDDIQAKNKAKQDARSNQAALQKQANDVAAQQARESAALKRQRQQAFNAQYQAPEGCEVYRSDRHMVECVNHKMRARRAFESSFEQAAGTGQSEPPNMIQYSGTPNGGQ